MKPLFSIMFLFLIMQFLLANCVPYDFFFFTLEWPKTRCETKKGCCHPTTGLLEEDFIVHELQPKKYHMRIPLTFCDPNITFDQNKILNLRKRMEMNWPSLDCPSNDGLLTWSAKWDKYGTCSVLSQHEYFQAALNLKEKLNLLKILKDGGIEPSRKYFSMKKIESVVKEAIGYTPGLICVYDRRRNRQLHIVRFCVDISGKSFIECLTGELVTCKDKMRLPPFTSSSSK